MASVTDVLDQHHDKIDEHTLAIKALNEKVAALTVEVEQLKHETNWHDWLNSVREWAT